MQINRQMDKQTNRYTDADRNTLPRCEVTETVCWVWLVKSIQLLLILVVTDSGAAVLSRYQLSERRNLSRRHRPVPVLMSSRDVGTSVWVQHRRMFLVALWPQWNVSRPCRQLPVRMCCGFYRASVLGGHQRMSVTAMQWVWSARLCSTWPGWWLCVRLHRRLDWIKVWNPYTSVSLSQRRTLSAAIGSSLVHTSTGMTVPWQD